MSPAHPSTAPKFDHRAARPHLLTVTGRCDARAVMILAHALARDDIASAAARGRGRPYKVALRGALRSAWSTATTQRECAERDATQAATVTLNARTALIIAELRHDFLCASMIDSLPAMIAEQAAVRARALSLGVRL